MKTESIESPLFTQFDDQKVSYRRLGSGSRKILFFHGFTGSSAQVEFFRPFIDSLQLDVVCIDRPGTLGTNSAKETTQFELCTSINHQLIKELGWSTYELFGVSGGAPFLFAHLHSNIHGISQVTILCGLGPVTSPQFRGILKAQSKWVLKLIEYLPASWMKKMMRVNPHPRTGRLAKFLDSILGASSSDQQALQQNPRAVQILNQGLEDAFAQNGRGPKQDAKAYLTPWEIKPVYQGKIEIWHGGADLILPTAMSKRMTDLLPSSKFQLVENEGHYSLPIRHIGAILAGKAIS